MFKKLLRIAPQLESDGSYSPSKLALKLAVSPTTDYEPISYLPYEGEKSKIAVIFTEQKNMTMKNGKMFSTGNHPVEAILPMLHLKEAGFTFEIITPTGKPVAFEMWAMPDEDTHVVNFYNEYKKQFESVEIVLDLIRLYGAKTEKYSSKKRLLDLALAKADEEVVDYVYSILYKNPLIKTRVSVDPEITLKCQSPVSIPGND